MITLIGKYASRYGTPFGNRSLPPSSIRANNYHSYVVHHPFTAIVGPVRPWFEQSGGRAVQYHLVDGSTWESLIKTGFIVENTHDVLSSVNNARSWGLVPEAC